MRHPLAATPVLATVLIGSLLAGCGDLKESSLCTAYDQYLVELDTLQALDPAGLTAQEALDQVEVVASSVRRLGELDEGRVANDVEGLSTALDNLQRTLASFDQGEDYEVWRPLVEDSLDDVADAATQLQQSLDPQCRPGS